MEHIPAWQAAIALEGTVCPARVTSVSASGLAVELDLVRIAPGRSPTLSAELRFHQTVSPERARRLKLGDAVEVVVIDVGLIPSHEYILVSLPADPAWLTWNNETVRRLARHIRDTGETDQLPILADALEDAGCTDAALLTHCREPHEHGARSWAVDLLATQQ